MKTIIAYQPNNQSVVAQDVNGLFGIPMGLVATGFLWHSTPIYTYIKEKDIVAKWIIKLKENA